ncbi:MAG: hypothetical protein K8F52_04465 [Candidatus Scalindua rubra]|nr:hypothetical protein [Candidatus Scalindua rubra]
MKRTITISIFILIVLLSIIRVQIATAIEGSTRDEIISYLEKEVPEVTGIKTYFSGRILGNQVEGTKEENYKLNVVNRELIIIEKNNIRYAKTIKGSQQFPTSQTRITEVIKLENLNQKISLIYKINPTQGDDAMKSICPVHIKIKIKANQTNKWQVYKDDIEQVTSMLNQTGENYPKSHYEAESCLLLTTDETAVENIAKALSHLILLCGKRKQIND